LLASVTNLLAICDGFNTCSVQMNVYALFRRIPKTAVFRTDAES